MTILPVGKLTAGRLKAPRTWLASRRPGPGDPVAVGETVEMHGVIGRKNTLGDLGAAQSRHPCR